MVAKAKNEAMRAGKSLVMPAKTRVGGRESARVRNLRGRSFSLRDPRLCRAPDSATAAATFDLGPPAAEPESAERTKRDHFHEVNIGGLLGFVRGEGSVRGRIDLEDVERLSREIMSPWRIRLISWLW